MLNRNNDIGGNNLRFNRKPPIGERMAGFNNNLNNNINNIPNNNLNQNNGNLQDNFNNFGDQQINNNQNTNNFNDNQLNNNLQRNMNNDGMQNIQRNTGSRLKSLSRSRGLTPTNSEANNFNPLNNDLNNNINNNQNNSNPSNNLFNRNNNQNDNGNGIVKTRRTDSMLKRGLMNPTPGNNIEDQSPSNSFRNRNQGQELEGNQRLTANRNRLFGNQQIDNNQNGQNNNFNGGINNLNKTQVQKNNINDNLKKDTEELKSQERYFYIGSILTFGFFYTIFVDMYNLFNYNWGSFHNIFVSITTFNQLNINDLLIAFNVLFLSFLILILLIPKTLFKDTRNHVYMYSLKIEMLIKSIVNAGIFDFNKNRDEIVKIIFLLLINTFIIIFYHISINTIFNYQDNQVGILRTFIYGTLLFGSIVFYNHQFDDIIIKVVKNNLVQNRKDIAKILFTLIFYTIGIVLLIFGIKYVADFIYNFFYSFQILQPLLQKM